MTLSAEQAKAFYDRFGAKQDSQAFYEGPALQRLVERSEFGRAHSVLEFGCGTGRFAARLLSRELPADARYLGLDVSDTMVALAASRLREFGARAEVRRSDGTVALPAADHSFERLVATYVTDLLSEPDILGFLEEGRRILTADGRLCLAGITHGVGVLGRAVSRAWSAVHAVRPSLLGGCRPLAVAPLLTSRGWAIEHSEVVVAWALSSEVVVARSNA